MGFAPEIKRPLGTMDPRIFRTESMGLKAMLAERPLASRFEFDRQREVLFINFAGLALRNEDDLRANVEAFIEHIKSVRPTTVKGVFIQGVSISPTMGPGIAVAVAE